MVAISVVKEEIPIAFAENSLAIILWHLEQTWHPNTLSVLVV
jgi:hypothetical protein